MDMCQLTKKVLNDAIVLLCCGKIYNRKPLLDYLVVNGRFCPGCGSSTAHFDIENMPAIRQNKRTFLRESFNHMRVMSGMPGLVYSDTTDYLGGGYSGFGGHINSGNIVSRYKITGSSGTYNGIRYVCNDCTGSGCSSCRYMAPSKICRAIYVRPTATSHGHYIYEDAEDNMK